MLYVIILQIVLPVNFSFKLSAILILTNLGATTESCRAASTNTVNICRLSYGKYLPIIGDFRGVGAGLRARPVKISFS